jgi:tetratricopeptide (TPR) repeat protein
MVLQEALAVSATWALANHESARGAFTRAIEIAQQLKDEPRRMRLLVGLHIFFMRVGEIGGSLAVAQDFARSAAVPPYRALADCLIGGSLHFMGEQKRASEQLERGLSLQGADDLRLFGLDTRLRALVELARVLWIAGFPDRALKTARQALALAEGGTPLSVCFSYIYTVPVFLWCGDDRTARQLLEKLMAHPHWHALPSMHATAFALLGALLICEGDTVRGIERARSAVAKLRSDRQHLFRAPAVCALTKGLVAIGETQEALSAVDDAIAAAEDGTEMSHFPELLRLKAEILLVLPKSDEVQVEAALKRSLSAARRQNALSWELRTAMTIARSQSKQGSASEGRHQLATVLARFEEGFGTSDLEAARQLLDSPKTPCHR